MKGFERLAREERGQIIVWFALMLVALVAFAGLVIDGTFYFKQRQELQAIADGAALAGGMQLNIAMLGGPPNWFKLEWCTFCGFLTAKQAARDYCALYGITDPEIKLMPPGISEAITVKVSREIDTFFIHIVTSDRKVLVTAEAIARLAAGY